MKVIKTLNPGMPGTKKYLAKYGQNLHCVRYRYDEEKQEQLTTIEYIVSRKPQPKLKSEVQKKLFPHPNRHVLVKVEYHEEELRKTVRRNGGIWVKDKRMWKLPCHTAYDLGMGKRIQEIE